MNKAIGIIGGMGPEASGYLYSLLIDKAIRDFGAKNNDDFPEIILYSVPVPDFISNNNKKSIALDMLLDRVLLLNQTNISCLTIACNTAHILLPQLQEVSSVPFISMIDEVITTVKKDGLKKIGILATPSTLRSNLYQRELQKSGIESIIPVEKQMKIIEGIIRNILVGELRQSDRKSIINIADSQAKKGAEGIILGCTELPLIFPSSYNIPVFNSVEILSLALLRDYYK